MIRTIHQPPNAMNPRDFAVLTLDEKRLPGMPRQTFKRRSPRAPEDPRDRALAEQIILGVVKNYLHLRWLMIHFAQRPIEQIDNRARLILLVALYQHRFLDRVPDHAIVTEAVAQTRRLGEPSLPRAAGFVNAVLREAIRGGDIDGKLPSRSDAPAYAEVVLSHPRPLFARLEALLGAEDALLFCEHDNRTPPTLVRLARGHTIDDLRAAADATSEGEAAREGEAPAEPIALEAPIAPSPTAPDHHSPAAQNGSAGASPSHEDAFAGASPSHEDDLTGAPPTPAIDIAPHEQPGIVVVRGGKQADFAHWSEAGLGQVQDATSAAIVGMLDVRAGMTVLDRCCGVGTKTQQLAELVGDRGRVFAVDAMGSRISTLRRLASRRPDLSNVTTRRAEWMKELPVEWPDRYDRILIDAPCSNSGVLARRAEARYIDLAEADKALPPLQLAIVRDTWPSLAPDGLLAYATCSVFPQENGEVVRSFLSEEPGAELVMERATLPSFRTEEPARYHDGGYVAVLRRR